MSFRPRAFPALARSFGRGRVYSLAEPLAARPPLSDDLQLFATTFVGGFLFMAIYLG